MTTYVDSSALVPIYVPESFSAAARAAVRAAGQVPFTALHELEVSNAFELLVGRGALSPDESRGVQAQLRADIQEQRLRKLPLALDQVFADAGRLSRTHTAAHLAHSLDLLHVAAAHAAGCDTFVSADTRQLAVAQASGLRTIDITLRARPLR
jgi:predicted nucleic acid-binding protein